jgi:MFS family permease
MASASFAPIRHRSFALSLALGVYLTETTHNPVWLGLLTVAAWTPALIGSPLGGVVAERWSRQRWIQANNMVMALTASILATAALTHHLTPRLSLYLALVEGLCSSASWSAWNSLLPDLVDRDEVLAAVSLSSAQFNLGRIIGPMLAGVALAFGSPGLCFALNAASFIFVVIVFAFVRSPSRPKPTTRIRVWAEIVVGAKQAWAVRGCRYPIIGVGTVALIASPFIALVPAMAIQTLHAGRVGVSWLVTAQGVGAVIGAVLLPAIAKRTSRLAVLRGSLAMVAVSLALYGVAPNLAWAVSALVVLGGAYVGTLTGLNTAVQLHAPLSERSRILSLYTLSLSLFYPLGALAQSALAQSWGVRPVTLVAAAVLALAIILLSMLRPMVWGELGSTPTHPSNLLAE